LALRIDFVIPTVQHILPHEVNSVQVIGTVAVLTYRNAMTRKRKARGPYYLVDNVWKSQIRALMERRGISQAELARRIGASPPAIVLLFKADTVQSGLVPAVHRVLQLDPPQATTIAERDDAKRKLDRIWADLDEKHREVLLNVAEQFKREPR
jgi:transcriptional regulator with XRE-family HTH domain